MAKQIETFKKLSLVYRNIKSAIGAVVTCAAILGGPMTAQGQWTSCSTGICYGNVGVGSGTVNTTGTQFELQQTGDQYGPTAVVLQNRTGLNGALFQNSTIDLVDFGFLASSGNQDNIRFEHRSGALQNSNNSQYGEIQLIYGTQNQGTGSWFVAFGPKATIFNTGMNVGIGTGPTPPTHTLQVAGTIGAQEVMVTSSGADYVFAPDYSLRPLNEVKQYIQDHHHLPDIPSETEVRDKGLGLGEMQTKLLAKIEER